MHTKQYMSIICFDVRLVCVLKHKLVIYTSLYTSASHAEGERAHGNIEAHVFLSPLVSLEFVNSYCSYNLHCENNHTDVIYL